MGLLAVGHRVVHGGDRFSDPVLVDDEVVAAIEELEPLAPLHNPAHLEGIRVARERVPGRAAGRRLRHRLPPRDAGRTPTPTRCPRSWREEHRVRRYGFHGTSYAYVTRRAAAVLGEARRGHELVVLHLGNGASAAAISGGRSIDTSMGLTPLEGLVMGTRSGDIDPGVFSFMVRNGMTAE